jgi:hypothetical protein
MEDFFLLPLGKKNLEEGKKTLRCKALNHTILFID